jgi:hypothetical protein
MPSGGYGRKRKCERNFSLSSRVERGIGILGELPIPRFARDDKVW